MIQFSVEIIKDSCVLILNMALIYKLKNHSIFFLLTFQILQSAQKIQAVLSNFLSYEPYSWIMF
jgi:hypothetical protein